MLKIREYRETDENEINILSSHMLRFLRRYYRPTKAGLSNKASVEHDLTRIVAISGELVVGTTQYCIRDDMIHIIGLSVHEEHRKQGIARALLNYISGIAERLEIAVTRAATIEETGNVTIFEHLGFRVVERAPDAYAEGVDGGMVTNVELQYCCSKQDRLTSSSPMTVHAGELGR